ncbi:MAG: hypothetical protein ACE147_10990 [Candidatus Methylomirabilales bacterium]
MIRWRRILPVLLAAWLVAGCALAPPATEPSAGGPRIANLRFEPDTIRAGGTTRMSFYFEVGGADLEEGFLIERGISQFQFYQALQPIPVDLRAFAGQVAGTAEVPLRWSSLGVRYLELYVVTKQGLVSNRLRAPLTVR